MSNIAVIYYSATVTSPSSPRGRRQRCRGRRRGHPVAAGGRTRPEEVIRRQDAWHEHYQSTLGVVEEATLEDLEWADGFALGTPTLYGLPAAQLKEFIDQTGPLWAGGHLSNKVATSFTSAGQPPRRAGIDPARAQHIFYHWGSLIVPPGYTHAVLYAAGGNPYGTSYSADVDDSSVSGEALTAAHYQGHRLAQYADQPRHKTGWTRCATSRNVVGSARLCSLSATTRLPICLARERGYPHDQKTHCRRTEDVA